ncbi:MAG: hypothetical protein ABI839_02470 [Verrucomicrobiota bacterium]
MPRARPHLYHLSLAIILLAAAYVRWRLPAWPLADPDSWSYLRAAVSKLAEGTFLHTNGRNFLYPGFLLLILSATRSFTAISFVQHLLGLGTGILILGSWAGTGRFLHHVSRRAHAATGLLIAAIYLLSRQTIESEHQLRPEAIAPFFALLNIWLTLQYFARAREQRFLPSGTLLGAGILLNSVILVTLKTSFAISIFFSVIPVLLALCQRRQTWARRVAVVFPSLMVAAVAIFTERHFAKTDPEAKAFLPTSLFSIHANLITRQMEQDLAREDCGRLGCSWLQQVSASLQEEIKRSRVAGHLYPSLGFSPDYLNHQGGLLPWRNRFFRGDSQKELEFYSFYYLRTARLHPGWMGEKIVRQMALFYLGSKRIFITSPRANLSLLYAQTAACLPEIRSYPPLLHYLARIRSLASTSQTISQPLWVRSLGALLSVLYPPVFFSTLGLSLFLTPALRQMYGRFAAVALFAFSYNFGNCLGTAVVHSLDVSRYVLSQYSFALLAEGIGLLFLVEVALDTRQRRLARSAAEKAAGKIMDPDDPRIACQ